MIYDSTLLGLVIATLGGTAIGVERQWSGHADGPTARFGGIRTFTMLGALAGFSGWLFVIDLRGLGVVLLAGAVAIIVAAYNTASRRDVDATTEIAGLVVLSAGVFAGIGSYRLASAIIAVTSLLLVEKSRLHSMVQKIDDVTLRAAVRFGVMALVVLPLLPTGPYGPFGGIRPRELWALVLFFSGLSFLGYIARRIVGASHGYLATGLLGGLISSTNVTFTFARLSQTHPADARELAFGAIAANSVLFPRVLVATAVLNVAMVPLLVPYLLAPALLAGGVAIFGAIRSTATTADEPDRRNPLQLWAALQMAAVFQVVLMVVHAAGQTWGESGVLTSAAVLGLTDVDALTVSMTRGTATSDSLELAALAIAVGVLANTALKLALALFLGRARYRTVAASTLAAILVVLAMGIFPRAGISLR